MHEQVHWADVMAAIAKNGESLSLIALREGVSRAAVTQVLRGNIKSHRIAYAIASASGIPTERVWPGDYLTPPAYIEARRGHSRGRLAKPQTIKTQPNQKEAANV